LHDHDSALVQALQTIGLNDAQIASMLQPRPRSLTEFQQAYAELQRRYGDEAPWLLFGIWRKGESVRITRQHAAPQTAEPTASPAPRRTPTPRAQHAVPPHRRPVDPFNPIGLENELPEWLLACSTPVAPAGGAYGR